MVFLLAVSAAACVFFLVRYFQLKGGYQALSRAEQRRAEVTAHREETAKVGPRARIRREMQRLGLGESLYPFYAAVVFVYLAVAAPLKVLGVPDIYGYIAALPLSGVAAYLFVQMRARRRRATFNRQLVDLLDQAIAQIKAGVGAERALNIVVPQMPDPLREEMTHALAAGAAGRDMVEAMKNLRERFPSRAFDMFISALEIDRAEGHAIAPALEQAAALLKQDFALASEAGAELAQIKYEFYAVAGIIIGIGLFLIFGGAEETRRAYFTPGGVIAVLIACANILLGFVRFQRMITKLKGDT